jgi:hypothetical protein
MKNCIFCHRPITADAWKLSPVLQYRPCFSGRSTEYQMVPDEDRPTWYACDDCLSKTVALYQKNSEVARV